MSLQFVTITVSSVVDQSGKVNDNDISHSQWQYNRNTTVWHCPSTWASQPVWCLGKMATVWIVSTETHTQETNKTSKTLLCAFFRGIRKTLKKIILFEVSDFKHIDLIINFKYFFTLCMKPACCLSHKKGYWCGPSGDVFVSGFFSQKNFPALLVS